MPRWAVPIRATSRRLAPLAVAVLTACGSSFTPARDADGGTRRPDAGPPSLDGGPAAVPLLEGTFEGTLGWSNGFGPVEELVVLHAVARPEPRLWIGGSGFLTSARARATPGGLETLEQAILVLDGESPCGFATLSLPPFALTMADDDGDGRAERLSGEAHDATFANTLGGAPSTRTVDVGVGAARDVSGPTLSLFAVGPWHPFDPLRVFPHEPLAPGATVRLEGEAFAVVAAAAPGTAPGVLSLVTPADRLLPFGTTLRLAGGEGATDLAGNPVARVLGGVATAPLPPRVAPNGFETALPDGVGGERVTRDDGAPVPSDEAALLVEAGRRFTARLPVPPGATAVTAIVRGLLRPGAFSDGLRGTLSVGVADGARIAIDLAAPGAWTPVDADRWERTSPASTVDVPLPPDAGDEVVVDLHVPRPASCPPRLPPSPADVLLDDLRAR